LPHLVPQHAVPYTPTANHRDCAGEVQIISEISSQLWG